MPDISAIAVFCDDVREERSGMKSIMGIYGDTVAVPAFPGAMPKFGIYVRIHISMDFEPCELQIFLNYPNGERVLVNTIEKSLVEKTLAESKATGNIIAGIYSIQIAAPFPVDQEGRIFVELESQSAKLTLGSINFIQSEEKEATTASTASPQPS